MGISWKLKSHCKFLSARKSSHQGEFGGSSLRRYKPDVVWALGLLLLMGFAGPSVCSAQPQVTIMEIQGSGQFSPFDGQLVETTGVVTLFNSFGSSLWMQDPAGDGDASTSDGIFVSGGGFPRSGPRPAVGDFIRIIAQVQEQQFGNALPLTRLRRVDLIEVLSSANPLPAPVNLEDLPNELITEGIDFWEPLEGMLVAVANAHVVAATSPFGEFAMATSNDAKPGSGFFPKNSHLLIRSLGSETVDYNPERILVDDTSLNDPIIVQPGDRVRSLVGVVDYTFGAYKLQPVSFDIKTHNLPNLPASTPKGFAGDTTITTFNIENLFDLIDNPDKVDERSTPTPEELDRQLTKLALAMLVVNVSALFFWIDSGSAWFRECFLRNLQDEWPRTTLRAFNLWYVDVLLTYEVDVSATIAGITKSAWGLCFTLLGLGLSAWVAWRLRNRGDAHGGASDSLVVFTGLWLLVAVMLPTRVHERYVVMCLPFLIVLASAAWEPRSILRSAAVMGLVTAASFQLTHKDWLPLGADTWSTVLVYATEAEHAKWVERIEPERRGEIMPIGQALTISRRRFIKAHRAYAPYEWALTLVSLGSSVALFVSLSARPRVAPPTSR